MKRLSMIFVLLLICSVSFAMENFSKNRIPSTTLTAESATLTAESSTSTVESTRGEEEPIRILVFGDIMMGRYVRVLMEKNGLYYPFEKTLGNKEWENKEWLSGFDIVTGNLEGPITERYVTGGVSTIFGFPPDTARILKNVGFNAVGLANNHMNDRGSSGYEETKKYLSEAGIGFFGNYNNPSESPVYFAEIKGKKIAFAGFNDVFGILDHKKAVELIRNIKKDADYVFVFPHWGTEYDSLNNKRQTILAKEFIDAGANAVIGHHPHVIQNQEEYKNKKIFYSLGNYIFDQYFRDDVQEGYALEIAIIKEKLDFTQHRMKSIQSQPYFINKKYN